jgi:CubicO group peptidase (beta-lactamase class C family)
MPNHRLDPAALDRAFAVAARRTGSGELPFVILGVANGAGSIRLEAATAPGGERRIGTDALCLLASITKPIVATAALRLVEQGRLGLKAPLADWLPELATGDGRERITAWHVLSHTSGLDDEALEPLVRQGIDREDLVAQALARPLTSAPGSRFRYATFTFELLALAMERATGQLLPELLRELVLDPLGMVDTVFDPRPGREARMAPVSLGEWDGTRLAGSEDPAVAAGLRDRYTALRLAGGGLWSTASDLLRFGRAMLGGGELDGVRILSSAFVDLATRELTIDGLGRADDRLEDEHYALGWGRRGEGHPGSSRAFGHGGASGTRLWVDPGHDLVVVYLSASWGMPSAVLDETLFSVYAATR